MCRCREVNIEPVPNRVRIAMMFSTSMQSTVSFYMFLPPCSQSSICLTCWMRAGMQTGFLQRFPKWHPPTGLHRASRRPCGTKHRRSQHRRPRSCPRTGQSSEATHPGLAQTARPPHMGVDSCHGKRSHGGLGAQETARGGMHADGFAPLRLALALTLAWSEGRSAMT